MFPPNSPSARSHQDEGAQTLYPRLKELLEKGMRGSPAPAGELTKDGSVHSVFGDPPTGWTSIQLLDEVL